MAGWHCLTAFCFQNIGSKQEENRTDDDVGGEQHLEAKKNAELLMDAKVENNVPLEASMGYNC